MTFYLLTWPTPKPYILTAHPFIHPGLISSTPTPKKTLVEVLRGKEKGKNKISLPVPSTTQSRSFLLAESDEYKIRIITRITTMPVAPIYQAEPQSGVKSGIECGSGVRPLGFPSWLDQLLFRWPQTIHLILTLPQLQKLCHPLWFIDRNT